MLNRFTANALGMPVVCGPVEATAIGNLLVQAIALGHLESHKAAIGTSAWSRPARRETSAGERWRTAASLHSPIL